MIQLKQLYIYLVLLMILGLSACNPISNEVVVYTTVDQVFSEPLLKAFEEESGIRVKALFDTEETKSTGVMNRLIAEKDNPQCDLFWSGDPVRNAMLQSKSITAPYQSASADLIPAHFKEKNSHWTGFSARARVLIYNTKLISRDSLPRSVLDLTHPRYKGQFTMANPLFGTTTFHMAALFTVMGDTRAREWMEELKSNEVIIATSNGDVKKRVINGEVAMGLTDTDDAFEAMKESGDVEYIFMDQQQDGIGTLVMPNAVSLIRDSPNTENGKILMDHLLSREREAMLAKSCAQMPLIKGTEVPENVPSLDHIVPMKIDYSETSGKMEEIQSILKQWVEE